MPALVSYSKEAIIEKLTAIIKEQEAEIERLQFTLALLQRKAVHGCVDQPCSACDKPVKFA